MRKIAENYMNELSGAKRMSNEEVVEKAVRFHKRYTVLLVLGILSVLLYVGLYLFNVDIIAMAKSTYQGHKGLFFVPILLALLFSFIHGAFTAKFWDVLGVKAKSAKG